MHGSPRLNFFGRLLIVQRVAAGWPVAAASEAVGSRGPPVTNGSVATERRGEAGLEDRPCRPHRSPQQLTGEQEAPILRLRQERKLGPHRLAALTGMPRSTCHKVLVRHWLHRLDRLDRPTGRVVRRYERERPGELVHVDVKKLGRIPPGGGPRVRGWLPGGRPKRHLGYNYVHSMVDDHSRLAYSEVLPDERGSTCAAFLRRAGGFFAAHGTPHLERVMTDNAFAYRNSREWSSPGLVDGLRLGMLGGASPPSRLTQGGSEKGCNLVRVGRARRRGAPKTRLFAQPIGSLLAGSRAVDTTSPRPS